MTLFFVISVNLDVMRQDCLDAYKWIFDKLPDLIGIDLDQSRVLVCGHSAGALLTAFLVSLSTLIELSTVIIDHKSDFSCRILRLMISPRTNYYLTSSACFSGTAT